MAIVFTGAKTVTTDAHPNLTGAQITTIIGKAPELWTVAEYRKIGDALSRVQGGGNETATLGSLLT